MFRLLPHRHLFLYEKDKPLFEKLKKGAKQKIPLREFRMLCVNLFHCKLSTILSHEFLSAFLNDLKEKCDYDFKDERQEILKQYQIDLTKFKDNSFLEILRTPSFSAEELEIMMEQYGDMLSESFFNIYEKHKQLVKKEILKQETNLKKASYSTLHHINDSAHELMLVKKNKPKNEKL